MEIIEEIEAREEIAGDEVEHVDGGGLDIVDVEEVVTEEAIEETAESVTEPVEEVAEVVTEEVVELDGANVKVEEEVEIVKEIPPDVSMVGKRMDTEARWYVLHTFSGYEVVAEDNLKKVIEKYNLQDRVFEIFIPTEDTVVEKRDKKVLVATKTMPSYIFIKMIYGDDLWHTITRTRGITGFVGPRGRPFPLTSKEVIDMKLERRVNLNVKLEKGDTIQIVDGPLAGQTAVVSGVDAGANKCTADVSMFGRPTSVELYLNQVKKLN